jgi:neurofibromin 1
MLLISMLRCLTQIISGVSMESRYGGASTFWLGLGILQTGRIPLTSAAIDLLVAALKQAEGLGLAEAGIQQLFLAHRPRDVAVIKLDAYTGVDFDTETTFTFSVAALVYRGMRLEATRTATKEVFGLLMAPGLVNTNAQPGLVPPQCLAYFLCRYSVKNNNKERKYLVDLTCGKGTFDRLANYANVFPLLDIPDTPTAIMVIALLFGMLRASELEYERVVLLTTLAEAARQLPDIIAIWYVAVLVFSFVHALT